MLNRVTCLFIFIGLLLATLAAKGQDPHFAGVEDMKIWYNPAMKTNKIPLTNIAIRNVNYPNIISYSSKALTIELPMVSREATDYDNIFFMNLAAGISTDNSNDHFLNTSTAMLALSYAMPLNYHNFYLSIGLQGNYTFNRVGNGYLYQFPDQFDKYGALGSAMRIDPFNSGLNYGFFTAGVGVNLFHTGEQQQWYIGGSIRHFNHPFTEWSYSARLPSNDGIQAGYKTDISSSDAISGYVNFMWHGGTNEQFIGSQYNHKLNDSTNNAFFLGACLRAGDALIPDAGVQIGKIKFTCYYEINISGMPSGNYHRKAFEFFFNLNF